MTIKQVRFVKADSRNPVQDIAEVAVFDASGNPVDPSTLVKQAAHVADPAGETPTKDEFIALRNALVTAGMMASA